MVAWRSWPKCRPPPASGPPQLVVVATILVAVRPRDRARAAPARRSIASTTADTLLYGAVLSI
uniref:Uncharacterized protein n=1 Tax=Arundo donax TaxID=35708 RepID=A0A0A9FZF4_ARUDO